VSRVPYYEKYEKVAPDFRDALPQLCEQHGWEYEDHGDGCVLVSSGACCIEEEEDGLTVFAYQLRGAGGKEVGDLCLKHGGIAWEPPPVTRWQIARGVMTLLVWVAGIGLLIWMLASYGPEITFQLAFCSIAIFSICAGWFGWLFRGRHEKLSMD